MKDICGGSWGDVYFWHNQIIDGILAIMKVIHWFRQDLRLKDNPAFAAACKAGEVLPIYILDDENSGKYKMGETSKLWLHHSLNSLNNSLGGKLVVYNGCPAKIIPELVKQNNIEAVFWNRCYEVWRIKRDKKIKDNLKKLDLEVQSFNGSLLWEPWDIAKADGTNYKVFTPFYRKGCLKAEPPRKPLNKPKNINLITDKSNLKQNIKDLKLLPEINWHTKIEEKWDIGEAAAHKKLKKFLADGILYYKEGRNFPAKINTSRLSPHLHFGEVSPNSVWYAAKASMDDDNLDTFLSELGWREFSYSLLYFYPDLPTNNLNKKFDNFPWSKNKKLLQAWQQGQTGYPIVDAGMRELWQTGYMHNRVRMIVGSFLVKNLLLHWHDGESWFWDCLVDADLAANSASWQWVAGCGADAAPYFRVFNPILQGEKFDKHGEYTRHYVPELKDLPDKYLYKPWDAPIDILQQASIELGVDYPHPIVDVKLSREAALDAFKSI